LHHPSVTAELLYVFLGKASYSVWVLCFLLDGVEAL